MKQARDKQHADKESKYLLKWGWLMWVLFAKDINETLFFLFTLLDSTPKNF